MKRLAFLLALACVGLSPGARAEPLQIDTERIDSFAISGEDDLAGPLEFLGGLVLRSENKAFGGLSGIDIPDGETAFMIGDSGTIVRAKLLLEAGRLVGLAEADIDSLVPEGETSKVLGDAEDIAFDSADPQRGVIVRERQANAMLSFEMRDERPAAFTPQLVGAPNRILRSNAGLESVAFAPPASPIAGEVIAIAEHPGSGQTDIPGWIAGVGSFDIVRRDDFDVSSARFLANGDLLLLERRYVPAWDIALRMRRILAASIKAGGRLDGDIILDASANSQIDNMEGLAVHEDAAGRTILTLISDNNFNFLQRTILLQFALSED